MCFVRRLRNHHMAKLGVPPIHGPFCSVEMGLVNKTDVARLHGLVADTIIL